MRHTVQYSAKKNCGTAQIWAPEVKWPTMWPGTVGHRDDLWHLNPENGLYTWFLISLICICLLRSTVKTLITHTFQWTVQAMGFQRLWVGRGGKKISTQESWQKISRKSYFLCYNGSAGPEGKHSMPFGQVIVDALLLNGVGFVIEQDWSGLQVNSREFGD